MRSLQVINIERQTFKESISKRFQNKRGKNLISIANVLKSFYQEFVRALSVQAALIITGHTSQPHLGHTCTALFMGPDATFRLTSHFQSLPELFCRRAGLQLCSVQARPWTMLILTNRMPSWLDLNLSQPVTVDLTGSAWTGSWPSG